MLHKRDDLRVLVLSGGKGTRSANPALPKLLQELTEGVTLLENQLNFIRRSGFTKVTFLVNYEMGQISERLESALKQFPELDVSVLPDRNQNGTTCAVAIAVEESAEEKFLLLLGDLAVSGSMKTAFDNWQESGRACSVMVHPNNHPEDSDCILVDAAHQPIQVKRKTQVGLVNDLISLPMGGMIFFERRLIDGIDLENTDVSTSLAEGALQLGELNVFNLSTYFKDSGTESRLGRIREDISMGAFDARGADQRAAIFLDRDGTLVKDAGTTRAEISMSEVELESATQINRANRLGIPVFLVTNQPGIAKGQISFVDLSKTYNQLQNALRVYDALLDDFRFCPHHPETGFPGEIVEFKVRCSCRKPEPGMLTSLASQHDIDLSRSFVIGDTDNDRGAAAKAGATYIRAVYGDLGGRSVGSAIKSAIDSIKGEQ